MCLFGNCINLLQQKSYSEGKRWLLFLLGCLIFTQYFVGGCHASSFLFLILAVKYPLLCELTRNLTSNRVIASLCQTYFDMFSANNLGCLLFTPITKYFFADEKTISLTTYLLLNMGATYACWCPLFVLLIVSSALKVQSCPPSFHLKGEFTFNLLNGTTGLNAHSGETPLLSGHAITHEHKCKHTGRQMTKDRRKSQRFSVWVCVSMHESHLEHQSTHAENHAEQVHVVRRGVLQCGIGLCAGWLVSTQIQNVTSIIFLKSIFNIFF